MAKVIVSGWCSEDDPIYRGGYTIILGPWLPKLSSRLSKMRRGEDEQPLAQPEADSSEASNSSDETSAEA